MQGKVIHAQHADVDRSAGTFQAFSAEPRPFHAFPGDLQQQPLLGVHFASLGSGYPEETRVEAVHLIKEGPSRQ